MPPTTTTFPPIRIGDVDWRNTIYRVTCGTDEPTPIALSGGRGGDGDRWLTFRGAASVTGHPDVVVANLDCLVGDPSASPTSRFMVIRVAADGTASLLAEIATLSTTDVTMSDDGTVVIGAPTADGGYQDVTITWDAGTPVVGEPVAAQPPTGATTDVSGIDDPAAGLSPTTTTIAVSPAADPIPAACVSSEIGPNTRDRAAVAALQLALARRGYDPAGLDGLYGPNSQQAVASFALAAGDVLLSFTGGDQRPIVEAVDHGIVRIGLLDALGIGCPGPVGSYEDVPVPTTTTTTTTTLPPTTTTVPPTTTVPTTTTTLPPTTLPPTTLPPTTLPPTTLPPTTLPPTTLPPTTLPPTTGTTLPPPAGVISAVDWRNTSYELACGGEPRVVTLIGGRSTDSTSSIRLVGAAAPAARGDVVVVNLGCVTGSGDAAQRTTHLVVVRVADGVPSMLGAFAFPATGDILLTDDGTLVVGYPLDGGYESITIGWENDAPIAQPAVPAQAPGNATPAAGLDDPSAGLAPTTTIAVPVPADPVPAECVSAPIDPASADRAAVAAFQLALARRGYDIGDAGADGYLGPATQAALTAYVEQYSANVLSFAGGDVTVLDAAIGQGLVGLPILDALGIGCDMS
ncbi:MAG: hypothetical protein ACK5OX_00015 [Desertimonas sp.]